MPLYIGVFLYSGGEAALRVLVSPFLSQELNLGSAAIGIVVGVFGLTSLLTRLPVGAIYNARRARVLLVIGGALSAGAFALVPLIGGPVPFAILMGFDGIGWSIGTTVQLAVLVAARPEGLRTASAMGWYAGFTGLGHTVAGTAGGFVADTFGYDAGFLMLAAIPVLATIAMVTRMPSLDPDSTAVPDERATASPRELWRTIGHMPAIMWAGVLLMFDINFVNGLVTTFQPVLALAAGMTLTQIGVLASCRSLASSFVRLGSGPLFARSGGAQLTTPLVLLGAAAVVLIPTFQSSFVASIPLFLGIGLSRGLLRVTGTAEAFEGTPDDDRHHGLTAALLHSGLDLGKLAGPLLGGIVASLTSLETMFRALPLVLLTSYGLLELAARRSRAEPAGSRAD